MTYAASADRRRAAPRHAQKADAAECSGDALPVQLKAMSYEDGAAHLAPGGGADAQSVANAGVRGAGGALPFREQIQASFGAHDVSNVQAYTGSAAGAAADALGARAYATGDRVAFGAAPDLHTAAHEAAHVVQQRRGVSLKGGVGESGDAYEQHADRVADLVVQGKSAEATLSAGPTGSGRGVQRDEKTSKKKRGRRNGPGSGLQALFGSDDEFMFGSEEAEEKKRPATTDAEVTWTPVGGVGMPEKQKKTYLNPNKALRRLKQIERALKRNYGIGREGWKNPKYFAHLAADRAFRRAGTMMAGYSQTILSHPQASVAFKTGNAAVQKVLVETLQTAQGQASEGLYWESLLENLCPLGSLGKLGKIGSALSKLEKVSDAASTLSDMADLAKDASVEQAAALHGGQAALEELLASMSDIEKLGVDWSLNSAKMDAALEAALAAEYSVIYERVLAGLRSKVPSRGLVTKAFEVAHSVFGDSYSESEDALLQDIAAIGAKCAVHSRRVNFGRAMQQVGTGLIARADASKAVAVNLKQTIVRKAERVAKMYDMADSIFELHPMLAGNFGYLTAGQRPAIPCWAD